MSLWATTSLHRGGWNPDNNRTHMLQRVQESFYCKFAKLFMIDVDGM
jgi:hypothetical protein